MKKIKFLCTLLLILVCGTVYATEENLSISITDKDGNSELTVAPGKTVDVYINMSNQKADVTLVVGTELRLVLPEGFELEGTPQIVEENWNCPSSVVSCKQDGNGVWKFTVDKTSYSGEISFKVAEGKMYKFTLKATSAVASETPYKVTIDMFYASDSKNTAYFIIDDYEEETLDFNVTVSESATETEKITLTKKYNTYVPAKALDFSSVEGLTAYYVTAVTATEATLTPATTVAAGEGIILEGTAGTEYDVPVASGEVTANSANLLATGTISEGDFILYDGKFVPCSGGTLPDGKAYLPKVSISSSAKALILGFGDATGINEAKAAKADGAIYSISGVRVAQPQKGVYIMNGRKVIVK